MTADIRNGDCHWSVNSGETTHIISDLSDNIPAALRRLADLLESNDDLLFISAMTTDGTSFQAVITEYDSGASGGLQSP